MKVAFVGSSNVGPDKRSRKGRCMFCEALLMHNIENISYAPTNLDKSFTIGHADGNTHTIALSCSIPILNKFARRAGKSSIRKIIVALQRMRYMLQVARRLPRDKVDAYVIFHLWDYAIPFFNLLLRFLRPTIVMWFGGSLRWYEQSGKWKYYIFVAIFRISLRLASLVLISLDTEQEYYLFKVLKLPRSKVVNFKEYIVDDRLFRRLDKRICAKKVGFDTNKTNIVMVSRIESAERVALCKDYEKDPFTALEIFRYLAERNSKVKLHVFGRGQGMEEFERRVNQHKLEDKVKIHGWMERERLPEYYSAGDLTFYPHPFITINDGQANHESLLCGTPVIYFKRYPWVKTEHQGGFAVDRDPELGARQILSRLNPTYILKKREEAASIPRDFTIEAFGDHLTKILRQLLNDSSEKIHSKEG